MAAPLKGRSSRHIIERPIRASWREASLNSPPLILSLVNEAATLAPFTELRQAASVALIILRTIQAVKENKETYGRLGEDSGGLIVAIWCSFKKTEYPREWLSAEMREILEDLTHTLKNICLFVQDHMSKNKAMRLMLSGAGKIAEYREHLCYAMQKFELQSHMNINDVLMQILRKNDQLSEQILRRNEEEEEGVKRALGSIARNEGDREMAENFQEEVEKVKKISELEQLKQVEIDRRAEDKRWHSDELKKIEKETKERQSELERLRAAANKIEIANRLKKTQEEIAELRRKIGPEEVSRRATTQVQSSKKKDNLKRSEGEENEWGGDVVVEEATSEEDEVGQPVKRSSKVRRPSKSPKRRSATLEESTDDDETALRSPRMRRKLSSTSLRVVDTEDESTDDDNFEDYGPSRPFSGMNPKVDCGLHSLISDDDDFTAQINGFMSFGRIPHGGSPMYTQSIHCDPYFPTRSGEPYVYGVDLLGIVNSRVGNITNSIISNVGNNNSVKKVYRASRSRSPLAG